MVMPSPAMRRRFLFSAAIVTLICAAVAERSWGGVLTIETQTVAEVTGDRLAVSVAVTNKGTTPAARVQVHLTVLGEEQSGPVRSELAPGAMDKVAFQQELGGVPPGRYPLAVSVDFHDANQYPFSAVSGTTFFRGQDVNSQLAVRAEDVTLAGEGEIAFHIKNLADEPRKIEASLFLPKELSVPAPKLGFRIDPRSEKTVSFRVRNFSALEEAAYPTFCFFEYELAGRHYTTVSRSVVRIGKPEPWFRRTRIAWMGASLFLIALIVLVQAVKRRPAV